MAFNFVGGSYTSSSPNLDAQRSLNLYYETDESGQGKNKAALMFAPGLANFVMLPTSPIRGMLATDAQRLFVVAGAVYYEVFQNGTYLTRGNVGDDAVHSPVSMFPNGTEILIVSAGLAWRDTGVAVIQADYQNGSGTVTTAGINVTWISGDTFDSSNEGQPMVINGVTYTVAAAGVTSPTSLMLTASAGTQGSTVTGTCSTSGTAVTWVSGAPFDPAWTGVITINGTVFTISEVISPTSLTLTAATGTGTVPFSVIVGVPYTASYPVTASCGAFLDGYFIVAKPAAGLVNRQINISGINDGSSWNPLDYAIKEGQPDGIVALLSDHEELWIFGNQTIEVWNDTGAAAFPLQRNPSGFIVMGCVAPYSPTRIAGSVGWLGGDTRGWTMAYLASGFQPKRVSTYAVEAAWNSYAGTDDAISYSYTDDGHQFWVITFPSADATWVYDATEGVWHERGWWNGSAIERHRANTHAFVWMEHLVGDHSTGQIYSMSTALDDDAGTPIYRIRSAPHIANESLFTYFNRFVLDLLTGTQDGGTFAGSLAFNIAGAASIAIGHGLGTTNVIVQVFDGDGVQVDPEAIRVNDANTVTLTFGAAFTGTAFIVAGTAAPAVSEYSWSWSGLTSVTLMHGLGTIAPLVQVVDSTGLVVKPETVTVTDANTVTLTFAQAFSGSALVLAGMSTSWYTGGVGPATTYTVNHNLGTTDVLAQVYDASGVQASAEVLQITGPNTIQLTFGSVFAGTVAVLGQPSAAIPTIALDWSDDGGHTWCTPRVIPLVAAGVYLGRVEWRRLGKSRDRVFRVTYCGGGTGAWINAYVDSSAGRT